MADRYALGLRAALLAATAGLGREVAVAQPDETLDERLDRLEAQVVAAEDISALKRLQRTYGYYVDKGMWEDVANLYTQDAIANYPAGTYIGYESIRKHLYMNVGGGQVGENGLPDNRIYNHMNIQPVVHLDPGGQTAKGRWRAFAMFGGFGGGATWAEGVYEMTYAKENGVWKIKTLDYHSGFGAPYTTGWAPPEPPPEGARPRRAARATCRIRRTGRVTRPAAASRPHARRPCTTRISAPPTRATRGPPWTCPLAAGKRADARDRAADLAARAERLARRARRREPAEGLRLLSRPPHVGRGRRPLRRQRHDRDGSARRIRRQGPRPAILEPARSCRG